MAPAPTADLPFAPPPTPDRRVLVDEQVRWWFVTAVLGHQLPPVTDDELQATADELRRRFRLTRAADTHAWLDSQGWTLDDFERMVERRAALRRLRRELTAGQVEPFYEQNRAAFEHAELAVLVVDDEARAAELAAVLADDPEASFAELARAHSLLAGAEHSGGYLGWVPRAGLKPGLAAAVFTGTPATYVGPIRTDQGLTLLHIIGVERPGLTDDVREMIEDVLFDDWLAQQLVALDLLGPFGSADRDGDEPATDSALATADPHATGPGS